MSRISKELKEFKEILKEDEDLFIEENDIKKYDLHFLIDLLSEELFFIDDSRDISYTIHSLEEIVIITIIALFANCNNFLEIHLFAEKHFNWLQKHLKLDEGLPSLSTFKRVIAIIKPAELEPICNTVFMKFVSSKKDYNLLENDHLIVKDIISLDGKTCNSSGRNAKDNKIKNVNAMSLILLNMKRL